MTNTSFRAMRKQKGLNQKEMARFLRVSQPLVSQWENGTRKVPARRMCQLRKLGVDLEATELPLRKESRLPRVDYAQELANLGYPGFAHLRTSEAKWNPAQLLVMALSEDNLDRRAAEALPWLGIRYSAMNWDWVRNEVKVHDAQNRLGFTLTLARKLALKRQELEVATRLEREEEALRGSLLAKDDTYCYERMTPSERTWLHTRRSADAANWHVLSDLEPSYLTHA
ncbi:MAG: hypothetical protein QOD84_2899 [Acidobacteriaceae bacterium]|jgi:transcriptional regulator with XRE-family HTH domain